MDNCDHHFKLNRLSSSLRAFIDYFYLVTFTLVCLTSLIDCQSLPTTTTTPINSLNLLESEVTTNFNSYFNSISSTVQPLLQSSNSSYNSSININRLSTTPSSPSTIILDLATNTINHNDSGHSRLTTAIPVESAEATTTTIKPSNLQSTVLPTTRVTAFLDQSDEVNTQQPSTITIDVSPLVRHHDYSVINSTNNRTSTEPNSESYNISTATNKSSPTTNSVLFKSPLLLPSKEDNESMTTIINGDVDIVTTTINPSLPERAQTTTYLTIELDNTTATIKNNTENDNITNNISNKTVGSVDSIVGNSNVTLCEPSNSNDGKSPLDHYQARKFFLLTMILLAFCCTLIIVVLILVVYIYRKLSRERSVKVPNNVGSVEFDTIKDGRFHQWQQGNTNSAFDSSDLTDTRIVGGGYPFLEGSVVPYTDRYQEVKSSSTETFGHHHHSSQQHLSPNLNQPSSFNNNSLPKTIDTRL